jgi:hypothetical protein
MLETHSFARKLLQGSVYPLSFILLSATSTNGYAIFFDGKGHYSLTGQTETHPGFDRSSGYFQAIKQNFTLDVETRISDKSSVWLQLRLFDNPRAAYLGDQGRPNECSPTTGTGATTGVSNRGNAASCSNRYQSVENPGYEPYNLKATQLYATYATEYCLIKAGRRARHWGLGAFLNEGSGLFDTSASIYDGVTCEINIQKTQTLGFSFGYDKLAESGGAVEVDIAPPDRTSGATKSSDDLDQYFFTIEYDDRKANAGSGFSQNVGFYFANIVGGHNGPKTDVKYADLFASFYLQNLVIKQEVLFRLGKSADPSFARLGGSSSIEGNIANNDVQSIAATGAFEYVLKRSGEVVGPPEFNQGNAESHSVFMDYAYAPGDRDGYYEEFDSTTGAPTELRDRKASAIAFHPNFKPALILFNGSPDIDGMRVDGIFDPNRVMNATTLGLGYRFQSLETGNFELKLIGAKLTQAMSRSLAKDVYASRNERPVGYDGSALGYELDLKYNKTLGKYITWGLAGAIATPGDAWKIHKGSTPTMSYLLQSFGAIQF